MTDKKIQMGSTHLDILTAIADDIDKGHPHYRAIIHHIPQSQLVPPRLIVVLKDTGSQDFFYRRVQATVEDDDLCLRITDMEGEVIDRVNRTPVKTNTEKFIAQRLESLREQHAFLNKFGKKHPVEWTSAYVGGDDDTRVRYMVNGWVNINLVIEDDVSTLGQLILAGFLPEHPNNIDEYRAYREAGFINDSFTK